MSRNIVSLAITSSILLLLVANATSSSHNQAHNNVIAVTNDCSGKAEDCHAPAKYLGERSGCACFACEYKTRKQHILCTRNDNEKAKLFKIIREGFPQ